MSMREIRLDIEIKAPISMVWGILIDFNRYPEWNPYLRQVDGEAEEGHDLDLVVKIPRKPKKKLKTSITLIRPNAFLSWIGKFHSSLFFEAEHSFELKPSEAGNTWLIQREHFGGLILPFIWRDLAKSTQRGFETMNLALKIRAESMNATVSQKVCKK